MNPATTEEVGKDEAQTPSFSELEKAETSEVPQFDTRVERSLKWKSDLIIIPLISLSYLMAYLDRNNLGNARVMSLQKDTHITDKEFYNCLMIFFVGYLVFALPGNLALRAFGPNRSIGAACACFGMIVCCMSTATNYSTVIGLRFLVGFGEAFIQGGGLYLSLWYKRNELGTRASLYYSASTISGVFSGLIAYGVQRNMDGRGGRAAWQWLFIIEGSIAVGTGILVWLLLPSFPDTIKKHWLLNQEEIALAQVRANAYNVSGAKIHYPQIFSGLKDPRIYMFGFIFGGIALGTASVSSFLPTFVAAFGYSPLRTQLFSIIPYACVTVSLVAINYLSDRFNSKFVFLLACQGIACIGYVVLMAVTNVPVRIFGTCLVASGLYPSVILIFSWCNANSCGYTKRATMWAVAQVFGQCFSIIGTHVYTDPPRFVQGHGVMLAFISCGMLMTVAVYLWMRAANAKKDRIEKEYLERGEVHPHIGKTLEEEGDYHISFRYML